MYAPAATAFPYTRGEIYGHRRTDSNNAGGGLKGTDDSAGNDDPFRCGKTAGHRCGGIRSGWGPEGIFGDPEKSGAGGAGAGGFVPGGYHCPGKTAGPSAGKGGAYIMVEETIRSIRETEEQADEIIKEAEKTMG